MICFTAAAIWFDPVSRGWRRGLRAYLDPWVSGRMQSIVAAAILGSVNDNPQPSTPTLLADMALRLLDGRTGDGPEAA